MFFDTHAHYDDKAYDADRDEAIALARDAGAELIVNCGTDEKASLDSIALAEKYPFFYAAVGWHPEEAGSFTEESAEQIRAWAKHPRVVAIGEVGLDYHYEPVDKPLQAAVFVRHMELARELDLPVIIHDREAHADVLEIVRQFPEVRGVFHSFSGSPEMAKIVLELGWYLGFNGVVTFKNAKRAPEVVAMCPADRLLMETDCPYLTPEPNRGKRNSSAYLTYVAAKMAAIRGVSAEEVYRITVENGKRLFSIRD
ncbi:MAG: TatD family hydrolase [Oscillospiraceae bacterium]|jgi:TatD DNase family protein|nr:TatD family hydrolase [Oscillospiraceae bacterium]